MIEACHQVHGLLSGSARCLISFPQMVPITLEIDELVEARCFAIPFFAFFIDLWLVELSIPSPFLPFGLYLLFFLLLHFALVELLLPLLLRFLDDLADRVH